MVLLTRVKNATTTTGWLVTAAQTVLKTSNGNVSEHLVCAQLNAETEIFTNKLKMESQCLKKNVIWEETLQLTVSLWDVILKLAQQWMGGVALQVSLNHSGQLACQLAETKHLTQPLRHVTLEILHSALLYTELQNNIHRSRFSTIHSMTLPKVC